jgi:hypothetical protein
MPVACDPATLVSASTCFNCVEPRTLEAIKTYLLCQILQNYEPTMACDPKSLAAASACFNCISDPRIFAAIQTQLLCNILTAVGGGSGGVICGALNPPVADPGVTCQLYYNETTGGLWYWANTTGIWVQLIGG